MSKARIVYSAGETTISTIVQYFISEMCEIGQFNKIKTADLFKCFYYWYLTTNYTQAISRTIFAKEITKNFERFKSSALYYRGIDVIDKDKYNKTITEIKANIATNPLKYSKQSDVITEQPIKSTSELTDDNLSDKIPLNFRTSVETIEFVSLRTGKNVYFVDGINVTKNIPLIYFVYNENDLSRYKVGRTLSLRRRIKQLQTGSPDKLRLYKAILTVDIISLETKIKNFLQHRNIRGEWFYLDAKEIDIICTLFSPPITNLNNVGN